MLYEEKDEFEKAIDTFKKAIEIDPLSEGLYQHLMQCYQRLGRRAEALVLYNNLKESLSSTFGIEPSPQTAALYKILINK
jgi:DNA-binding SARP family transcriptional activator